MTLTKSPNLEAHLLLLLLLFGGYHNDCSVVFPRGPLSADFGLIKLDYIIMVDLSLLYVCGKCMGKGFSMYGNTCCCYWKLMWQTCENNKELTG